MIQFDQLHTTTSTGAYTFSLKQAFTRVVIISNRVIIAMETSPNVTNEQNPSFLFGLLCCNDFFELDSDAYKGHGVELVWNKTSDTSVIRNATRNTITIQL